VTDRAAALALALLTAAGLCLRLGDGPVVRNPERRIAIGAEQMLASGDWWVPVVDGAPRLQKPPLYTWAAAASGRLAGSLSRTALRLPSVLAALGLLAVVFAWGRSLGGRACGLLAASLLIGMAQFWSLGRRGVAEMMLACFATLALFAFDRARWAEGRRWRPVFFLALLLALLAKATTALLLVGVPVALQLARERRLVRALRATWPWAAACVAGAGAWWIIALARVPGAWPLAREALLLPFGATPSIGSAAHHRSFWFFVPLLPAVSAPAIALAPLVWRREGRLAIAQDPRARFLARSAAAILLGFSAIPMKQKHYLLPLLPLLALLLAVPAVRLAEAQPEMLRRGVARLTPFAVATCVVAGLLLPLHLWVAGEGGLALPAAVAAAFGLCALAGFATGRRGALRAFAACCVAATLLGFTVFSASVAVWHDRFQAQADGGAIAVTARWDRAFAALPALRRLYAAE
jgi:4-amino-4-deoxy-L-arabinose transferase-like glycosyltransferase